jgi:hypothetical protein
MEPDVTLSEDNPALLGGTEWSEDDAPDMPFIIRPSWNVMVTQLAGGTPEPIRVSDYGRGSRVISRALSGDHDERDMDDEDDEPAPRRSWH